MSPISPTFVKPWRGTSCLSSHSRACGPSSVSANSRTVFWRRRCSSLRLKSKGRPSAADTAALVAVFDDSGGPKVRQGGCRPRDYALHSVLSETGGPAMPTFSRRYFTGALGAGLGATLMGPPILGPAALARPPGAPGGDVLPGSHE